MIDEDTRNAVKGFLLVFVVGLLAWVGIVAGLLWLHG